jgi:aspartokinase
MLFTKPANLNGEQLKNELSAAGIEVERITVEADGQISIDITSKDATKASSVISAHIGSTVAPERSIEEKLASVGLSLTDLKSALGL